MKSLYYEFKFPDAYDVNDAVVSDYLHKLESNDVRKSHLFNGRYENIYIDRKEIPALSTLIPFWISSAATVLKKHPDDLQCGFWFNDMRPGDVTEPHSHDDDDEWLSGVYYLKVPENSGELILHADDSKTVVQPVAGKLVLFSSSNVHEVSENRSQETRLSIGMNFGRVSV